MIRNVPPRIVARRRTWTVVDIRTREERDVLGWIPGSVWVPAPLKEDWEARTVRGPVAVACLSGRRSLALVRRLRFDGVDNLKGGLMAWQEAGLPIGETEVSLSAPLSPERMRREAQACFIGTSMFAERSEGQDIEALLGPILQGMDGSPEAVRQAVERMSVLSWRLGVPLEIIAKNTAHFFALCEQLAAEAV